VLTWFLWPVSLTEQEKIQLSLSNIVTGIEKENMGMVLDEISENYADEAGWNRQSIRGILFREFKKGDGFSLFIVPSEFEIESSTADITAKVTLLGGSIWNPNSEARQFIVHFDYLKEDDDVWRLQGHQRTDWEE
jgi:hypothetical protein